MRRLIAAGVGLAFAVGPNLSTASAAAPLPGAAPTEIVTAIVVDAPLPVAGESRDEYATLRSDSAPVPGETLELWVRRYGSDVFTLYDSAVTDSNGNVVIALRAWHNVRFQWRYSGTVFYEPSRSSKLHRVYSTRVRAKPRKIEVAQGQRVVFRGSTRSAKGGFAFSLFRGTTSRGGFVPQTHSTRLKRGVTRADGTFRIAYRFHRTGWKKLFIQVRRGEGNVTGWSRYLHVKVT